MLKPINPLKTQKYRFFDQEFELHSNHAETLTLMEAMFRRFAVTHYNHPDAALKYTVLTNINGHSRIITKDFCYVVDSPNKLRSLAHGIILGNTLAQIRSHLLFHAAALSWQDKGVILAADSGCGKTTLTLALVRQGFQFLSDDVAALGFNKGELAPYPRSLLVREHTFELFHHQGWHWPAHQVAFKNQDRTVMHLAPALWGKTCQPYRLIIVQRPDQADERICELTLDHLPEKLWHALGALGIQTYAKNKQGFPVFKAQEALINRIHQACEQQGVLVLDVAEQSIASSYFQKTPQLQAISKLTATMNLLSYFLGHPRSVLIQQPLQRRAVDLIEPLINMLKPVHCYQLTPGRLDQTVELIHALCD